MTKLASMRTTRSATLSSNAHGRSELEASAASLHAGAGRVSADVDSADLSGVSGTPTFFVNGHRHLGAYDIDSLSRSVRAARARAAIAP